MSTDDVLRQARELADEQFAFLKPKSESDKSFERKLLVWSMRPDPKTPAGKTWETGARQGWNWAQADLEACKQHCSDLAAKVQLLANQYPEGFTFPDGDYWEKK